MSPRSEYGQQYRVSFGGALTPAIKALLIANVAVFVLELFVNRIGGEEAWDIMLRLFALNPLLLFRSFFVWQLVTYMFLHSPGNPFHILFNMLILWMFGCDIERVWGAKRFLRYYFICGIGGGLLNCAFAFMQSQTLGASGAIFGVIVAYGMLFPTRTILFWGIFPMTARQFALLLGAIELVSLGALSADGVARFAHLGGALTGYIMLKGIWNPSRLLSELRWRIRRRRFRTIGRDDDQRRDRDRSYPFH
jgi:rhomboid family protein